MILSDVAMIAADTSRSKVYLDALLEKGLFPNYVLVFETSKYRPGQCAKKTEDSVSAGKARSSTSIAITKMLNEHGIPYSVLHDADINSQEVIGKLKSHSESVFIYSGFGSVLLRKQVLNIGKRFLHVHGGFLPDYKGSTTNYFSLLKENKLGASSLFLNEKIDSGDVLLRAKFEPPKNREEIDHIYDSEVRAKVLVDTLAKYSASGDWDVDLPQTCDGETYYIIHPLLKHIAILADK